MYTWNLIDRRSSKPIAYGKEAWFRNAIKDMVHFARITWTSSMASVSPTASSDTPAVVYFYREKGEGNKSINPPIYCNGHPIGVLDNGRYFVLHLAPGHYVFASTDDNPEKPPLEIDLAANATYYLEIKVSQFHGLGSLRTATEENAPKEIKKLKPEEPDRVASNVKRVE